MDVVEIDIFFYCSYCIEVYECWVRLMFWYFCFVVKLLCVIIYVLCLWCVCELLCCFFVEIVGFGDWFGVLLV